MKLMINLINEMTLIGIILTIGINQLIEIKCYFLYDEKTLGLKGRQKVGGK